MSNIQKELKIVGKELKLPDALIDWILKQENLQVVSPSKDLLESGENK
mgnify:CR=1 FL=1